MDQISFEVTTRVENERVGGIRVFVNGRDLVELLREHELPMADAEGSPSIAGGYAGLPAVRSVQAASIFMGKPLNPLYSRDEKVQLLECECGAPGCWPMLCTIQVENQTVTWMDFEQPHRTGKRGGSRWDYDGFGPLTFDRAEYDAAVQALDTEIDRIAAD